MVSEAEERRILGYARVRDAIFDAVYELWLQRKSQGTKKKELARIIGYNPSQITRALAGPANWTLETVGALVEALDGNLSVKIEPREKPIRANYNIYLDVIDGVPHYLCPVPISEANNDFIAAGSPHQDRNFSTSSVKELPIVEPVLNIPTMNETIYRNSQASSVIRQRAGTGRITLLTGTSNQSIGIRP